MSAHPPKVLLITARADLGGGPRHVLDLLRAFAPDEVRFYMAAPEQRPFAPLFRERCEKFVEIPPRSFSPLSFARLARLIRSENIEIIHSHGRGAGLYSRPLGLLTGRPVLHSFHGVHSAPGFVGRVKLMIDQAMAFLPFHAILSSEAERERALAYHLVRGQKLSVVANAVDLSRFSTGPRAESRRVGAFLRADSAKGPDLWLQLVAAAAQTPELREFKFTCAGITREDLAKYGTIPENLEIAGPLENPVPWLESLGVFVSTSRTEGLPLGVLEAMAARVPCLLSAISAHEIFFRAGFAQRFDADSPSSFGDRLREILSTKADNQAESARKWVEAEFSPLALKLKLIELYDSKNACSKVQQAQ